MGSVGPFELLLVGLIALIALGPKRLPEVARSLGKGVREFKTAMEEPPPKEVSPPAPGPAPGPAPAPTPGPAEPQ